VGDWGDSREGQKLGLGLYYENSRAGQTIARLIFLHWKGTREHLYRGNIHIKNSNLTLK